MKVYTRTGDAGKTSLVDNSRVLKSSPLVNTVGLIDEANSRLGSLAVSVSDDTILQEIQRLQSFLFDCGAQIADPNRGIKNLNIPDKQYIKTLEDSIDTWSTQLPLLMDFILPAGSESAVRAHLARSAVRSAEREIVGLQESGQRVDPRILVFFNRLSDWLFVVARWLNHKQKCQDALWQKGARKRTT